MMTRSGFKAWMRWRVLGDKRRERSIVDADNGKLTRYSIINPACWTPTKGAGQGTKEL